MQDNPLCRSPIIMVIWIYEFLEFLLAPGAPQASVGHATPEPVAPSADRSSSLVLPESRQMSLPMPPAALPSRSRKIGNADNDSRLHQEASELSSKRTLDAKILYVVNWITTLAEQQIRSKKDQEKLGSRIKTNFSIPAARRYQTRTYHLHQVVLNCLSNSGCPIC